MMCKTQDDNPNFSKIVMITDATNQIPRGKIISYAFNPQFLEEFFVQNQGFGLPKFLFEPGVLGPDPNTLK